MLNDSIRCFWLEPTDQVELSLRRYRGGDCDKCATSGLGYHNVSAIVERASIEQLAARGWPMYKENGGHSFLPGQNGRPVHLTDAEAFDMIPEEDPRWPRSCSCGYRFADVDSRQFNPNPLFRRSDSGEIVTLEAAPAGAMWNAEWMDPKGPDRIALIVRTPGGEWLVDGPSYQDGRIIHKKRGWSRSGTIPEISADPGVVMPGYYGHLVAGWLVTGQVIVGQSTGGTKPLN